MLSKFKLNQLYFKDTQFANLMTRRIFNVLLIANPYDAFMLEDDGRIDSFPDFTVTFSSTKVFHSPQLGHLPNHLGDSLPQLLQKYTVFVLAITLHHSSSELTHNHSRGHSHIQGFRCR